MSDFNPRSEISQWNLKSSLNTDSQEKMVGLWDNFREQLAHVSSKSVAYQTKNVIDRIRKINRNKWLKAQSNHIADQLSYIIDETIRLIAYSDDIVRGVYDQLLGNINELILKYNAFVERMLVQNIDLQAELEELVFISQEIVIELIRTQPSTDSSIYRRSHDEYRLALQDLRSRLEYIKRPKTTMPSIQISAVLKDLGSIWLGLSIASIVSVVVYSVLVVLNLPPVLVVSAMVAYPSFATSLYIIRYGEEPIRRSVGNQLTIKQQLALYKYTGRLI